MRYGKICIIFFYYLFYMVSSTIHILKILNIIQYIYYTFVNGVKFFINIYVLWYNSYYLLRYGKICIVFFPNF